MTAPHPFVDSSQCRTRAHCRGCRDVERGRGFRLAVAGGDFECPYFPWGFVPEGTPASAAAKGPGTELKRLLLALGYEATPTCRCNAYATQMDAWGVDGCWERFDDILDWLAGEASRRGVVFVRPVARWVVWLAIVNAWIKNRKLPDGDH